MVFQETPTALATVSSLKRFRAGSKRIAPCRTVSTYVNSCGSLTLAVVLDKAHIKRSIVGNHNGSLTELQKFRQHRFDVRRVQNHVVVDAGQVLNPERDRDFRVDEGGKTYRQSLRFRHTDRTDLNDFVDKRGKSRRLDIETQRSFRGCPVPLLLTTISFKSSTR